MVEMTRRTALAGTALAAASLIAPRAINASDWPARPIDVIMPLQAGSASDVALRLLLARLGERTGFRFVVENVAGAAGMIGGQRAAAAAPDGHTLAALNNSILTILPNVQKSRQIAFDPFTSFEPITGIATIPTFLAVHKDVPVTNVSGLIEYARGRDLNYASGGGGSPQHLATEMFMAISGAKLTQIAYRGATAAAAGIAGGQVHAMFIAYSLALPFLDSGAIRFIGFGGSERHEAYPDLPTVAEQGVAGYDYSSWIALFAPKGTPPAIVTRLREETSRTLAEPDLRERMVRAGLSLWAKDAASVAQTIRADDARWKAVVARANITI
jgi:tripartite-type tricarboxylate transporter receptor subunit TctC